MILIIEWLKANWRYLGCLAIGLILGIGLNKLTPEKQIVAIDAKQAQSGSIETSGHVTIKPKPPIPSTNPACPPCPQLPDIDIDLGSKASGSQSQALSATASTLSAHTDLSLWIGAVAPISPISSVEAVAQVQYGKYAVIGQYGSTWKVGALFRAWEW